MTFYESELLFELKSLFKAKKYVVIGEFTNITRKLRLDTTYYDTNIIIPTDGKTYDVKNYMDETITLNISNVLKGELNEKTLVYPHSWFYNDESTLVAKWDTLLDSTSYQPAEGRHFLSFFDTYGFNRPTRF